MNYEVFMLIKRQVPILNVVVLICVTKYSLYYMGPSLGNVLYLIYKTKSSNIIKYYISTIGFSIQILF